MIKTWVNFQYFLPILGHDDGDTARSSGFAHSALASNEDPLQRELVNQVLDGAIKLLIHYAKYIRSAN